MQELQSHIQELEHQIESLQGSESPLEAEITRLKQVVSSQEENLSQQGKSLQEASDTARIKEWEGLSGALRFEILSGIRVRMERSRSEALRAEVEAENIENKERIRECEGRKAVLEEDVSRLNRDRVRVRVRVREALDEAFPGDAHVFP